MTETSGFIRYFLAGALALTGLLLPAVPADAASPGLAPSHAGRTFSGQAFDTCQAPDLATMNAWIAHSDYRAAGIYFGGRARACTSQTHLTPDWVRQTTKAGWSLLPIYVGSQSPCVAGSNKNPFRIDSAQPATQGASEAEDAVRQAGVFGLDPGSALYLDMEAYDIGNTSCAAATLAYIRAWDRGVAAAGYVTGFYSSADSGITHMERSRLAGVADLPQVLWYARWGVSPTLTAEPSLAPSAWTPHARIHQYHGAVTESHGGKTLSIDRDLVDAPVAVVG
ncbi:MULTISPECIES: glycoside hydrolase domain-containing protein [Streptomycetaceae]|uniref:glycoside hydrolase domain-containing protein n=1 Tax=Streptomycetaceae TaxID=2062 RepID=UPI00300B2A40